MIERKIIIGLITSTEYLQQINSVWDAQLLESTTAKRLASWVWEYFEKYGKAPEKNIEGIFYSKLKNSNLPKDVAEEIEEDILPDLSEEYENESFNLSYLLDQTFKYLKERKLEIHSDSIQALLASNELEQAEEMACNFNSLPNTGETDLDLSNDIVLDRLDKAFISSTEPMIIYPKQLGKFWNGQLVRGALVAFMASEKRGKTFWMLDIGIRGCRQKKKVAFFQAGDMTEDQQLIRTSIYLTKKSNKEEYSGKMWEPVRDCIHNQTNDCDKDVRECDFGIFEGNDVSLIKSLELSDLIEAFGENKDYSPCHNCKDYELNRWGVPWIRKIDTKNPLNVDEAKDAFSKFFIEHKRSFKLSTHANGTLSIKQIKSILAIWEKRDDFIPDIIIVDYADLLSPERQMDFRHQQNEIWKGLRNISQSQHCLLITATQADAKSYESNRLKMANFSEDKRKYAHVTAMYGLNQDPDGREKRIGLMRINELVLREGDFDSANEITVLQNLKRGRPFLGSFW